MCLIPELILELFHHVCMLLPFLVDILNNFMKFCLYHLTPTDFITVCVTLRLRSFVVYLFKKTQATQREKLTETASMASKLQHTHTHNRFMALCLGLPG